jgi:hypothetical protein
MRMLPKLDKLIYCQGQPLGKQVWHRDGSPVNLLGHSWVLPWYAGFEKLFR